MNKALRRFATVSIAAAASVVLAAGPAAAHFCYKTNENPTAAAGKADSANWVTFNDMAVQFLGICPAGVEVLAEAAGVSPDTLINGHGLMAGGTLRKGADSGNPAISHLDFEAIEAAEDDAFAACE